MTAHCGGWPGCVDSSYVVALVSVAVPSIRTVSASMFVGVLLSRRLVLGVVAVVAVIVC